MGTQFKTVRWEFDRETFAGHLATWVEAFGRDQVSAVLHVSPKTVEQWSRNQFSEEFPHPHLSNVLTVCNELDIDPRTLFTTSE